MTIESIPGVVHIERVGRGPAQLLIEVPHGADEATHYQALRTQLRGDLPAGLIKFFHVNTDIGAWGLARAIAASSPVPTLLLRSLIPRTFIDVNRVLDQAVVDGLTPGLQPYITHADDIALLVSLHQQYTEAAAAAYAKVLSDPAGRALIPHSYAPRSVPIDEIDVDIVKNLERVYRPDVLYHSPLRPEIDLITTTPEGEDLSPPVVAEAALTRLRALGYDAHRGGTYTLHPVTMGHHWSAEYPSQVLCLEVRRDLLTYWRPFEQQHLRKKVIHELSAALADALMR